MDLPGFVAVCGSSLFGWWLLQTNSIKSVFFAMCGYCSLWWSATDWTRFPKCLEPVRFPVIAKRFRVCVSGCLHPSACWQLCLCLHFLLVESPTVRQKWELRAFQAFPVHARSFGSVQLHTWSWTPSFSKICWSLSKPFRTSQSPALLFKPFE